MMGVDDTRAVGFSPEVLGMYESLLQKQLQGKASKKELLQIKQLKKELASLPESDPVSLTTEISEITKWLQQTRKQGGKQK